MSLLLQFFKLKLKTFVKITVVVITAIMKGKITNSLKSPLSERPSEVGYWEMNEMSGSGGCLRQKRLINC